MQNICILVVDTDKQLFIEAESALHAYQVRFHEFSEEVVFHVDFVRSQEEALAALKAETSQHDVVLYPHANRINGSKEFVDEVKTIDKEILLVVLAVKATLSDALTLTKAGAFEFMIRPLSGEDLRSSMKKAARHILAHRRALALEAERKKIRFQFISVLSHELKAPLAAIEGYLDLMRDQTLGENLNAYNEFLSRSLLRISGMRRLIFDMLDLTRLESGEMKVNPENLLIKEIAKEAQEGLAIDAGERGIKILLDIEEGLSIYADKQHITILCNNLISNAVKYNRNNGTVNFKARRVSELVLIECQDTGIGMTKEDVARLFGEFVRIKNEQTRNIPGSGLGLSILKKIVNLYHGSVRVDSEKDVGTTFLVGLKNY